MKEKIKFIGLIILFIVILFTINKLLDKQNQKLLDNSLTNKNDLNISNNEIIDNDLKNGNLENDNNSEIANLTEENIQEDLQKESNIIYVKEKDFEKEVLSSNQTVLVDFYADWCGPCQYLTPIIEEFAKDNPEVKIVKIDVDEALNISYEYGAMSIPTLVVFKEGKEVNRSVGVISQKEIEELVK